MIMIKFNFSIDGNYGFHLFQYLKDVQHKLINWRRLEAHIRKFFTDKAGEDCLINVRNYYIGNSYRIDDRSTKEGLDRKDYQNSLTMANFQPYLIQKQGQKEAGVDIRLAIDAVKHMTDEGVKYFVLFSGDGDFCTLLDELHDAGKEVLLLHSNVTETYDRKGIYTSSVLTGLADYIIDLVELANIHPELFDPYTPPPNYNPPPQNEYFQQKPQGYQARNYWPQQSRPTYGGFQRSYTPYGAQDFIKRDSFKPTQVKVDINSPSLASVDPPSLAKDYPATNEENVDNNPPDPVDYSIGKEAGKPVITAEVLIEMVKKLKAEREEEKGLPVEYIFLSDLGLEINREGYTSPEAGLKGFLQSLPNIFNVGQNPRTHHPVVSLKVDNNQAMRLDKR